MTTRLFAAVIPPSQILDTLDLLVEPRRTADPELRWAPRANWHLTLAFFGDVPDDRVEALSAALDGVASRPFALVLDGAGAFPNPAAGRVLYWAVVDPSEAFRRLSRRVRTAAERVGVPSDGKKQRPHLTLARRRRPADLTRWLRVVESFPPAGFQVTDFALLSSALRPSGPQYRVLHRFTPQAGPNPVEAAH